MGLLQLLRLFAEELVANQGFRDPDQVLGGKGLGEEEIDPLPGGGDGRLDVGVSGDHAGHDIQLALPDGLKQGQSVRVREAVIDEGDIEGLPVEGRQGLLPGLCLRHLVALEGEDLVHPAPDPVFIVNHQDFTLAHRRILYPEQPEDNECGRGPADAGRPPERGNRFRCPYKYSLLVSILMIL